MVVYYLFKLVLEFELPRSSIRDEALLLGPVGSIRTFGPHKWPSATLNMSESVDFLIWLIY